VLAVPDYDPKALAATAKRFSLTTHQELMAEVWRRVLAKDGYQGPSSLAQP
jgi:hypothetical protein